MTKLSAVLVFVISAISCPALDLATELLVLRTNYDLDALERSKEDEALVFRAYVHPALSPRKYAVEGKLKLPKIGEASGLLTLIELDGPERKSRTFTLTHLQAHEVHAWFSEAKFLDAKIAETVSVPVLDGVELVIEGYVDGRYFRLRRNAGDSPASQGFFRHFESFRIWKEEPNQ